MRVLVGPGEAFNVSTAALERAAWLSIFRECDKKGYYVVSGKWRPYSEINISKSLQGLYSKAKKGDADAAKMIALKTGQWETFNVRTPRV